MQYTEGVSHMSLTPKINIPSLFRETKVGLTPRADYHIEKTVAGGIAQGKDGSALPEEVARRIKQTVKDPANEGVNS